MTTTKINLNGISELDFTNGIASASNTNDVTTITLSALGVTSVGLTAPTEINVAGSPVTSSGTIALTWMTETANFVFAGPTSGAAATPNFRALVAADIPALPYVTGTGLTSGQIIIGAGSSAIQVGNLSGDATTSGTTAATVIKLRGASLDAIIGTAGAGQDGYVIYWDNASTSYKLKVITPGTGTVTSVALTAPAEITVGGSPVTTSGTLALTWTNESANRIFAGPTSGGAGTPSFRAIVAADIPSGTVALDQVANPISGAASFTFTGGNTLELDWSQANTGLTMKNTVAATSSVDQNSPRLNFSNFFWNGSGSFLDQVTIANVLGNITAHHSTLEIGHIAGTTFDGLGLPTGANIYLRGSSSGSLNLSPGTTAATITSSVPINATTGFRIGNAATTAHYLRGNGTNYVDSAILTADVPWTAPGTIGSVTPNTGAFTSLNAGSAKFIVNTSGLLTTYNNVTTTKNGVAAILFTSLKTAQAAALSGTALVASTTAIGLWRISFVATITTAATAAGVLGGATGFTITYTNGNGDTISKTTALSTPLGIGATNATSDSASGDLYCYAGATTAITYSYGYTAGTGTPMQYDIAVYAEFLG